MSAAKIKVPKALDGKPLTGKLLCPTCGWQAPMYGTPPKAKYRCPAHNCQGVLEFRTWKGQTGPETASTPIPDPNFHIRKKEGK